ncbi:AlpA family transcriptional regulator [Mesorhizobium sp. INR15]|uniref:helix-turn-helix transcriptional regulator n=1 Tax=Mesorhizobium sp. INR15 TaxID=2654248 RepID=UPI0018965E4F|nr:AlpA family phage regulatory protein [Mesorhizobium sp. INR15]QPC91435.1 AlpA family phage regulatory protein [Mesorhizobium sp. INR15]
MEQDGLLRLPQVIGLTALSRSEIYRKIAAGTFPKQRRHSHKVARWSKLEVDAWVADFLRAA